MHRGAWCRSVRAKRGKCFSPSFFSYQDGLSWHLRALHCKFRAVERRRASYTIRARHSGERLGGGGGGGGGCHVAECLRFVTVRPWLHYISLGKAFCD